MQRENVNNLGRFLDGWAHLVEGGAGKANLVRINLARSLLQRDMPGVSIGAIRGHVRTKEPDRLYIITKRKLGYTTIAYIADQGQDLYVSWRTYYRWTGAQFFGAFYTYALLVAICFIVVSIPDYFYTHYIHREAWGSYSKWVNLARINRLLTVGFTVSIVFTAVVYAWDKTSVFKRYKQVNNSSLSMVFIAVLLIAGLLSWGIYPFFVDIPLRPPKPPLFTSSASTRFWMSVFIILLFRLVWYLLTLKMREEVERYNAPFSVFDADDAIAMSLSVHKSLLHALDQVGIDTSQLHLHNETTQGRAGEPV